MPLQDGCCGFCDTKVADRDGKPLTVRDSADEDDQAVLDDEPDTTHEEEEPVKAKLCKTDGCWNEVEDARGMYGGLCGIHKAEKKEARHTQPVQPPVSQEAAVLRRLSLVELAAEVERTKALYNDAAAALVEAVGAL